MSSRNTAPLALVVIALIGSVAVPAYQTWLISGLLHETTETLAPARLLTSQLHAGLAEELALMRVPGAGIDDSLLQRFRILADSDDHRMASLDELGKRLDTAASRRIEVLTNHVATWRRVSHDAATGVRARQLEGEGPMRVLVTAHQAALNAVSDLSATLMGQAEARDRRMGDLDRVGLGWNIILVVAAFAALSSIAILMARERQSLALTQARARREEAMRKAAESFASVFTREDIEQRVQEAAPAVMEDHEVRISSDGEVIVTARPGIERSDESAAYAAIFGHLASLAIEKVRILEEARAGRDRLERVLTSRSRLIRGFSHDVKNPIGAADGYAALLSHGIYGELSASQLESVQRIRRSIQAALTLIHDLHELAAAETGHLSLTTETVDICALVAGLVEDYQAAANAAGLSLRASIDDDAIRLTTSPIRVRQIVSNLISNAIKYSEKGSVTVRATRVMEPDEANGAWARIDVADEGPGIPPEKQEFIFEEFGRIAPREKSGAGLGLAISRLLAKALGGQLTVQSAPGAGSTFSLSLPARREADVAETLS
jgi:signal transduction histidine kinase